MQIPINVISPTRIIIYFLCVFINRIFLNAIGLIIFCFYICINVIGLIVFCLFVCIDKISRIIYNSNIWTTIAKLYHSFIITNNFHINIISIIATYSILMFILIIICVKIINFIQNKKQINEHTIKANHKIDNDINNDIPNNEDNDITNNE